MSRVKVIIIAATGIVMACLLIVILFPSSALNASINKIVRAYRFKLLDWEWQALSYEAEGFVFGSDEVTADDSHIVLEYFSLVQQIRELEQQIVAARDANETGQLASLEAELDGLQKQKDTLEDKAEKVLERQVKETLAQLGIYNPMDNSLGLEVTFPPVNFVLEQPPHLLVISPREKIEVIKEIRLRQDITTEEIAEVEAAVDGLRLSSLVVELGGIATYPAFVSGESSLRFAINTAVEEWLHQYLFFKPLGFQYALNLIGITQDYEIMVMNETAVGIASDEIGDILYQNYYAQYFAESSQAEASGATETEFHFYKEMRQIRITVDEYLAKGEVEQAEEYMEQERLFLASHGYYIRKLNQAYFAFYGTYADSPTSVDPIGDELRMLRSQSASLSNFINTVAAMTSRDDLIDSIE
jgi:hypothetical protein